MATLEQAQPNTYIRDIKEIANVGIWTAIWRLMKGFRFLYIIAGLGLGIAAIARTGSFWLVRYFIDSYLEAGVRTYALWMLVAGFILLALLQGGFGFLSGTLAAHTAEGIARRVRNYMLDHIQHLPFSYHDEVQTGELVTRVTSDVDAMRRFFASQAVESSRIIFLFIVNFVGIWLLSWKLALISVVVIPVVLIMSVFFFRAVSKRYEEYQEQESVLATRLQENLTGVRVVKAFARQPFEEEKFEEANWLKFQKGKRLLMMHSLYWPFSDILCGIQMIAGYAAGALFAINGEISVGTYLAYSGMLILIIWPIRNLGRLVVEMSRGLVSLERVAEVVRQEREIMHEAEFVPPQRLRGEITFEHVGFVYGNQEKAADANGRVDGKMNGKPASNGTGPTNGAGKTGPAKAKPEQSHAVALEDITFHVKPGQRVALLGATGAGKTTLVNLLPRFYDYTSGRILLDGIELTRYSRAYLRANIGIVEQEPFLFSRTVRENIAFSVGREVTQDEIEAAAQAAAIHDVIMSKLPHGYDTVVGERGTTLSGGQKQRVAIARTLLKDPRILILDDSTSAVDTETEASIREALERLMENRTTFIIAHRIQSVMNADLIVVMNRGRIEQMGTHEELVAQEGMYRRIYAAQTRIENELQQELTRVESV